MRKILGLSAPVLGLLLSVSAVWAVTIHVPGEYPTIQEAVDAANYGDEILVAPGDSYAEPIHEAGAGDTTLCCVILKSGVTLRGSGIGQTIVDGDSLGRVLHLYQCVDVEIRDLTLTGGYAELYGSGIYCRESSPYIHDVEIIANYDGGMSLVENSNPTIEFVSLVGNRAKAGGGLEVELGCEPNVHRCEIIDNRAPFAGGVRMRGSATLDHCIIDGNRTTGSVNVLGGGILVMDQAQPTITYCEITNNGCFGDGGGIAFIGEGTGGLLEDCLIAGNEGFGDEGHGGGISVGSGAYPTIRGCIVAGNWTTGEWTDGGGLYVQYASADVSECTFYANWTEGIGYVAGNVGIETSMFIPGVVEITRSIVVDSPLGKGFFCTGNGDPPIITCCDVYGNEGGDDICEIVGGSNFSEDPLLCDPDNGNFHVEAASPCAPGNHPEGPGACGGLLIGAMRAGCDSGVDEPLLPARARLLGSRPNPFHSATTISLVLAAEAQVGLDVIDASGRRVALLHQGWLPAGLQEITWDGTTLQGDRAESGVYFYRLRCGGVTEGLRLLRLN